MSQSVGTAHLNLGLNYAAFNRQLSGISHTAENRVGEAFKGLAKIIGGTFAIYGLVAFSKKCIQLASDLNEVQNVVAVTFGSMTEDVNEFAKNALAAYGMSELSAKKYTSTMGAMLKSSGLTGKQMLDMSKSMTGLAGDMASFYNLSQDEAFLKIRSGIAGETEPLRQLGVNMTVANLEAFALAKGIKKSYQEMTQAQQILLRYNYLIGATKDAQGDFARTSNSWANQTRLLSEQWKIFQGTMGQAFINILTPMLKLLNQLILKLQVFAEKFKSITEYFFGAQDASTGAASAIEDVGSAVAGTGKAVKKSLASFDQLNVLSKAAADSMDSMGGLGATGIGKAVKEINKAKGNTKSSGDSENGALFAKAFKEQAEAIANTTALVVKGIRDITGIASSGISNFTAENETALAKFSKNVKKDGAESLYNLSAAANEATEEANKFYDSIMKHNYTRFVNMVDNMATAFFKLGSPVLETVSGIWNSLSDSLNKFMHSSGLEVFLQGVTNILSVVMIPVLESVTKGFSILASTLNGPLKVSSMVIKNIFSTMFSTGSAMLSTFLATMGALLTTTSAVASAAKNAFMVGFPIWLGTTVTKITQVKDKLSSIGDVVKTTWEGIKSTIKSSINGIIGLVNTMLSGVNKIKINIPEADLPVIGKVGGGSIGMPQIPLIPKLANGGLVSAPTLAMVGDNRGAQVDPEVISPLSTLQGMINGSNKEVVALLKLILAALKSDAQMVIKMGETELGRAAIRAINAVQRQAGQTLLEV